MESDKREESAASAAGAGSEPATGHGQGAGHVHGPGCSHGHDFDPLLHDPNHLLGRQPVYRTDPKIGRNDPCPCGSGKKYKKCHGT